MIVTKQNTKGFCDMSHVLKCTINAGHESMEKTGAYLKSKVHKFTQGVTLVF